MRSKVAVAPSSRRDEIKIIRVEDKMCCEEWISCTNYVIVNLGRKILKKLKETGVKIQRNIDPKKKFQRHFRNPSMKYINIKYVYKTMNSNWVSCINRNINNGIFPLNYIKAMHLLLTLTYFCSYKQSVCGSANKYREISKAKTVHGENNTKKLMSIYQFDTSVWFISHKGVKLVLPKSFREVPAGINKNIYFF